MPDMYNAQWTLHRVIARNRLDKSPCLRMAKCAVRTLQHRLARILVNHSGRRALVLRGNEELSERCHTRDYDRCDSR